MRVLLTGGAGDLGDVLSQDLLRIGRVVRIIDVTEPRNSGAEFIQASILDRQGLSAVVQDVDCIVHIAAWHGIHEGQGTKTAYEFHDLNVTGTFNVLQAAADRSVKHFVFISSTSVDDPYSIYGHSKILGEEMCRAYAKRHNMKIIVLRPRAFIPPWNRGVYRNFIEWAKWFMKGSVHVCDVKQAVMKSIAMLTSESHWDETVPVLTIDGAYEYTTEDLKNWDDKGEGSTFRKYYEGFYDIAVKSGLNPAQKPKILDITKAKALIGYSPRYSLKNLLEDLKRYGLEGPPST
jgi:nucleoside-diphosphate-sugar epimerase